MTNMPLSVAENRNRIVIKVFEATLSLPPTAF